MSNVCLTEFKDDVKGKMKDKDADDLIDRVKQNASDRIRANLDPTKSVDDAINKRVQNIRAKRYQVFLNSQIFADSTAMIDKFKINGRKSAGIGLYAKIAGVQGNIEGARVSAAAAQKSMQEGLLGRFLIRMQKVDKVALATLKTTTRDLDVIKEILKPGSVDDPIIQGIAKATTDSFNESNKLLNSVGANEGKVSSYLGRQIHNVDSMLSPTGTLRADMALRRKAIFDRTIKDIPSYLRDTAYKRWRNFTLPLLNRTMTFRGADVGKVMRGVFDDMVSGYHMHSFSPEDINEKWRRNEGQNIAAKYSTSRTLIFNQDAEGLHSYMKQYGHGTMLNSIKNTLSRAGSDYGLMRTLGSDPIAMFDKLADYVKDKYRTEKGLKSNISRARVVLGHLIHEYSGEDKSPVGKTLAGTMQTIAMTVLGGVALKSLTDFEIRASKMTEYGISRFQTYGTMLKNIFDKGGRKDNKWLADSINSWSNSILADYNGKAGSPDTPIKTIARLQQIFYKFNLLHGLDNINRGGSGGQISHALGKWKSLSFEKLLPDVQRNLSNYGITSADWDAIRPQAINAPTIGDMIGPDLIDIIPREDIAKAIGKTPDEMTKFQEDQYRRDALLKWQTFYTNEIDDAQIQPGAATKAMLLGKTTAGTASGVGARVFAMFKYFGVEATKRTVGRMIYGDGAESIRDAVLRGKNSRMQLLTFMMNMAALTYISETASALSQGKTPPNITDPHTIREMFLSNGIFGYYGSMANGDYDGFQHSFIDSLGGPVVGAINQLAKIESTLIGDKPDKIKRVKKQTGAFASNFIPGANIPWFRTPANFMFLYHWHEHNDPGYIRNMTDNLKKRTGQEFFINPN